MPRYAETTSVPVERSKAEIERILQKYGADQFMSGWDSERAYLAFESHGRQIKFELPMPNQADESFAKTETGKKRTKTQQTKAWEQACRSRWRALALVIKAKLEAVETGITTFEDEFLAHTMLPNGSLVRDWMQPQIDEAYSSGKMPSLLPADL